MSKNENYLKFGCVFGVPIAKITRENLKNYLKNIPENQKIGLNFAYSEVVLRANRNQFYQKAISQIINICDGKGLRWSLWKSEKYSKFRKNLEVLGETAEKKHQIQTSSSKNILKTKEIISFLVNILKKVLFWIFLLWELTANFFSGILILIGFKFGETEIILGREFVYELFDLALQKNWKIGIIGGSDLAQQNLKKKFPKLRVDFWFQKSSSDLMRDLPYLEIKTKTENLQNQQKNQSNLTQIHSFLNTQNLISSFPDLQNAQKWLVDKNVDLVLICLGGASGKQEFFLDFIRHNNDLKFDLGVCLGAALDHLGGGKKQREAPKIIQRVGLEWLFRLISQPYRRKRIWDSIWTLFWWTSLSRFIPSETEVNLKNVGTY